MRSFHIKRKLIFLLRIVRHINNVLKWHLGLSSKTYLLNLLVHNSTKTVINKLSYLWNSWILWTSYSMEICFLICFSNNSRISIGWEDSKLGLSNGPVAICNSVDPCVAVPTILNNFFFDIFQINVL